VDWISRWTRLLIQETRRILSETWNRPLVAGECQIKSQASCWNIHDKFIVSNWQINYYSSAWAHRAFPGDKASQHVALRHAENAFMIKIKSPCNHNIKPTLTNDNWSCWGSPACRDSISKTLHEQRARCLLVDYVKRRDETSTPFAEPWEWIWFRSGKKQHWNHERWGDWYVVDGWLDVLQDSLADINPRQNAHKCYRRHEISR
jgi:hypothetical protein